MVFNCRHCIGNHPYQRNGCHDIPDRHRKCLPQNREKPEQVHPVPEAVKQWLDDYFLGHPGEVSFPLKPKGTVFQQQVWQILLGIPYGHTRTYGDIAREMAALTGKKKMSAQAIGQAVGKNPISILIPCHRVVGAGGKLTGYAGGLENKVWLLEHEGAEL